MKKVDFTYNIEELEKFFFSQLSERGKRLYAGLEAMKQGYYGVAYSAQKFSLNKHTVRKGKKEMLDKTILPAGKIRQKGGGRKKKLQ